jgi:hypothetical protein
MLLGCHVTFASDRLSILDYGPLRGVDRTGIEDSSLALRAVISAANARVASGDPTCVYLPSGTYLISLPPPPFLKAGCVFGDGPSQTIISIDPKFEGDLFAWSEAWILTMPGPMAVGFTVLGDKKATAIQNALVFYDRNDEVFIDNINIKNLHGRALYSGVKKNTSYAYMRESHVRSLRLFGNGAPGIPVIEFSSEGAGKTDATNEIRMSQIDIYGSRGPSFVVRNNGSGGVRNITAESLRIEGSEQGTTAGDLLTIGDPDMPGNVNNLTFTNLELINPSTGFAALRMTAPPGAAVPYQITVQGSIGGGIPAGNGLRIDAGRTSTFRLSGIHTYDTNVVIGPWVSGILLDGGGQEANWTYSIDPRSNSAIQVPVTRPINQSGRR